MRTPASDSYGSATATDEAMRSDSTRSAEPMMPATPEQSPSRPSMRFIALQPPSTKIAISAVPDQ